MEDWEVSINDEELLYDIKYNETIEFTVSLDYFNAYDDKGNKIEGERVKFIKKEYDNPR
jgi:hypothetical protein